MHAMLAKCLLRGEDYAPFLYSVLRQALVAATIL